MFVKVNVKNSAKCQKILEIEVSKAAIQEEFERYYNELRKTAQVPGFRKGKAPRQILEQRYANKANDRVLSNLVNDTYHQAVEKENIKPITIPHISDIDFKKDEKLTYQAKVDVYPNFNLKEYKNIKLKKQALVVKDEEVDKVLSFLQERYAQFLPIENRGTKIGDYVICDYSYSVNDKVLEKKEHVWLWVNKEMFIPGLSKELEGINLTEKKEFKIKLPEKFHPAEFAKQTALFSILVKEIKEKKLPTLNDEFAKMIGKNSLAELKTHLKEDLKKEKEAQIRQDIKSQLIDCLVKRMPIDVPPTLFEKRKQLLKNTTKQRLKQQGMTEEQIIKEEQNLGDFFDKEAVKQLRIYFIFENIAKKENIVVEKEEMDKRIELLAESYNQKKEALLKYLHEKNLLEDLHGELWEEKIVSFLIDTAKIEEVSLK